MTAIPYVGSIIGAVILIGQAATGPFEAVDWIQFGALGLIIGAILAGWVIPGHVYKREMERADRLADENKRLREHNETRVVPLLERALSVLDATSHAAHVSRTADDDRGA